MNTTFYSNGKLLISGEYVVLDGALALAMPTRYGQRMTVAPKKDPALVWESYTEQNELWFKARIAKNQDGVLTALSTGPIDTTTQTLIKILTTCMALNPSFLANDNQGYTISTHLDFPNDWGLGSSSTLINNVAQWAQVDAFELLHQSFGGSAYDIACAQNDHPILYAIDPNKQPRVVAANLKWPFTKSLFFIHLGKKMDSKKGIAHYRQHSVSNQETITQISELSQQLVKASTLQHFEELINQHELLVADLLQLPTVKQQLFSDYPRAIKSLGAWGGDFVLAIGTASQMDYFKAKGYTTILSYDQMILK